eukprot:gene4464-7845_t
MEETEAKESYKKQALFWANRAYEKELENKIDEALKFYEKASKFLNCSISFEENESIQLILQRIDETFQNSKKFLEPPTKPKEKSVNSQNIDLFSYSQNSQDEENYKTNHPLEDPRYLPNVSFDDISGLNSAKEALFESLILPKQFPQLFVGNLQPWKAILLYGLPGTGKTLLAQALANETNVTFISVSASDLLSKWVGDSEKSVKYLFTLARKRQPSIIFLDEIDALCSERNEGENDTSRRIKTEFLVQIQGLSNTKDEIFILGATNRPWELDSAVRRRFEKRIYISLPNETSRLSILKTYLSSCETTMKEEDWNFVVEKTKFFSGSDLNCLVRNAIMEPIRRFQKSTFFKFENEMYYPCDEKDTNAEKISLKDIPSEYIKPLPITRNDFEVSLQSVKSSISKDDIKRQEKFMNQFGS